MLKQVESNLTGEAQRQAVASHVVQAGCDLVAEFQEVESGKRADRPQLAAALASCRTRRAVLVREGGNYDGDQRLLQL